MRFADVLKGMSPQMHQQLHLSGGNVVQSGMFLVNENCRLVLAGASGWMIQFGNFL
jgi:hypothetical protein